MSTESNRPEPVANQSSSPQQSRRTFLKGSLLAAGASFAIGGTKTTGKIRGANDTIRIAVAGLNGRGASHVGDYLGQQGVEIRYLIDPDTRTYGKHLSKIKSVSGQTPKTVKDVREALDDPNLDAISIATPNHWHSLMSVWAVQAGKDVYVEKPLSHNVHEGRVLAELARKHQRIVQHGTQSRSSGQWAQVVEVIKSGQLGKLLVARALCYKPRKSIGMKPTSEPPKELDYNLWLGPAAERPFHGNLVHYNWHWFWDFGNGDIGNQGVHQMDVARWGIPGATLPTRVLSLGGRFGYEDQGQTANTQLTVMDFGPTQLIFEVRGLTTEPYLNQKVGNIFHLEAGTIAGNTYYPKDSQTSAPLPSVESKRGPGKTHFGNFIAAVRSRNTADLNADALEGHYSSALCHLANISYRLGSQTGFQPRAAQVRERPELAETLERMEQHLAQDNQLPVASMQYTLGRSLTFDPSREQFVNDDAANQLLSREYRKGFELPG